MGFRANTILNLIVGTAIALSAYLKPVGGNTADEVQGWTTTQRQGWYWGSQGSRLLPLKWFESLEQPDNDKPFADIGYLSSFGYLAPPSGSSFRRPIGFAVDKQPDANLVATKLRWYQTQQGGSHAEPWVGLNCSACHTAEIAYQGNSLRIDGGPSLTDFQSFIEALDKALIATKSEPEKLKRFSRKVLAGRNSAKNRHLLVAALDKLIEWQDETARLNATPLRYGYGRVDAFGHIYNKVAMFAGSEKFTNNPADAPVSFPFLWNIHRQKHVQWNGIAENTKVQLGVGHLDYGAMGRNTGEVLGVFGEVVVTPQNGLLGSFEGFRSSVDLANLDRMETTLEKLQAPRWPISFPPIDQSKASRGAELFGMKCATNCHKPTHETTDTETMHKFVGMPANELTDIWMACNAFTYLAPAGKLADGDKRQETFVSIRGLLAQTVVGVMLGRKPELVGVAAGKIFGDGGPPVITDKSWMQTVLDPRDQRRQLCKTTKNDLLAYKARPLDGIWATAPYLHNGSVPTLYDLLLPANKRPPRFATGNREYDPVRVGYAPPLQPLGAMNFEFNTVDEDGVPIDGNSNVGHEYGAGSLSDADRWALVEYLKTL
ncbi:di-heme-cytochrome C peroxidase [Rhizobium sp. 25PS6]|uniref:di-heme-cytochrome C peroxidase n=1 Tax=Rhizobium sp. 25PS6 TaxID=3075622 RepID=UPI0028FD2759|nr:di-heme-cytochrome C peroxidase [Rhizobium sp. 25PS6]MDU0364468.1 di-heme-cytochrome C peroxidase [Rhizobium sp. 25PS6]